MKITTHIILVKVEQLCTDSIAKTHVDEVIPWMCPSTSPGECGQPVSVSTSCVAQLGNMLIQLVLGNEISAETGHYSTW